jgi:hypothetical protein
LEAGAVLHILLTHLFVVVSKTHEPDASITFSQSVVYLSHVYNALTQLIPSNLHLPFVQPSNVLSVISSHFVGLHLVVSIGSIIQIPSDPITLQLGKSFVSTKLHGVN